MSFGKPETSFFRTREVFALLPKLFLYVPTLPPIFPQHTPTMAPLPPLYDFSFFFFLDSPPAFLFPSVWSLFHIPRLLTNQRFSLSLVSPFFPLADMFFFSMDRPIAPHLGKAPLQRMRLSFRRTPKSALCPPPSFFFFFFFFFFLLRSGFPTSPGQVILVHDIFFFFFRALLIFEPPPIYLGLVDTRFSSQ